MVLNIDEKRMLDFNRDDVHTSKRGHGGTTRQNCNVRKELANLRSPQIFGNRAAANEDLGPQRTRLARSASLSALPSREIYTCFVASLKPLFNATKITEELLGDSPCIKHTEIEIIAHPHYRHQASLESVNFSIIIASLSINKYDQTTLTFNRIINYCSSHKSSNIPTDARRKYGRAKLVKLV